MWYKTSSRLEVLEQLGGAPGRLRGYLPAENSALKCHFQNDFEGKKARKTLVYFCLKIWFMRI